MYKHLYINTYNKNINLERDRKQKQQQHNLLSKTKNKIKQIHSLPRGWEDGWVLFLFILCFRKARNYKIYF